MNKAELIAAIAAKTGDTKKGAEASVNAFVDVVTEALTEGDKVQLVGFGSFEVRIPLSEKLKGKDLVAYYVDDNGNKEEHIQFDAFRQQALDGWQFTDGCSDNHDQQQD